MQEEAPSAWPWACVQEQSLSLPYFYVSLYLCLCLSFPLSCYLFCCLFAFQLISILFICVYQLSRSALANGRDIIMLAKCFAGILFALNFACIIDTICMCFRFSTGQKLPGAQHQGGDTLKSITRAGSICSRKRSIAGRLSHIGGSEST